MRINASIIEQEGERVSSHSKFYIWEDKLFEPVYYRGKKCKTYKVITNEYRMNRILDRIKQSKVIPTVSSVCGFKQRRGKKKYRTNRLEILDL